MAPDTIFWLTVGPCVGAVVLSVLGDAFASRRTWGSIIGAIMLGGASIASLVGGASVPTSQASHGFRVGGGSSTIAGVALALAALVLLSSDDVHVSRPRGFAPLMALAVTGVVLATTSDDLGVTLLALETSSVCAYALVAHGGGRRATEAALKYFIQGAVATAFFVIGFSILAVVARGDLAYGSLKGAVDLVGVSLPVSIAVVLLISAIAFKAGSAPFHAWVPDAYGSAQADAAALLAGPVKLGAGAALAIVATQAVPVSAEVFSADSVLGDALPALAGLSVVSVLVGSLGALGQRSYGRMLGYAGVAQIGYALLAVASLNPSAALVHLALYAVAATGAFIGAVAIQRRVSSWDGTIEGLRGVARRRPATAASLTVCMVSLAGVPALAGFWGKFQVFGAGIAATVALSTDGSSWHMVMYAVAVACGLLSSVVSIAYYGAVIRSLYAAPNRRLASDAGDLEAVEGGASFDDAVGDTLEVPETGWVRSEVALIVIAVALVAAGLGPLFGGLALSMGPFVL